jgi:nucleoside-diphosphate-sugar epimerase
MSVKRVLLTGATGMIGRWLPGLLTERDYEVHAVHFNAPAPEPSAGVRYHRADLLAPGAAADLVERVRPSRLLHLAWLTDSDHRSSPANLAWTAVSLKLLHAFVDVGGSRAVLAGTALEYEPGPERCLEGNTPIHPRSLYGTCKAALGSIACVFAKGADVSLAQGRTFSIYGPFERPYRLIPSVTLALLAGRPAVCSEGNQQLDLLHAEDAARAFVELLDSGVEGPVNIGSGRAVSVREVASMLAAIVGRPELLEFGTIRSTDQPDFLIADTRRLSYEVGFSPAFTLEQGLESSVDWWRAN